MFTACFTTVNDLYSEPTRLFGNEGSYLHSNSGHLPLGIYSINDNQELMVFWSEFRTEDAFRGIYYQIVNEAGEFRFENPVRLTEDDLTSDDGRIAEDAEGNLFVAWFATTIDTRESVDLYAQKYDRNGNTLWGDNPQNVTTLEFEPNSPGLFSLIPDDQGGVYVLSNGGFVAIDEDCNLRGDWEWNGRRPDPEHRQFRDAISDGLGGFWYISSESSFMNRINYAGDKLWDEMRSISNEDFPDGADVNYPLCGMNGGLMLEFSQREDENRIVGIFFMDENGGYVGDEFTHVIRDSPGSMALHQRLITKLRDGRIAISYEREPERDFHEYWLTIYDPQENVFVENNRGVIVNSWDQWDISPRGVTEFVNGDLFLGIGLYDTPEYEGEYHLYSNELERRWERDGLRLEDFGRAQFGTIAGENELWLFGQEQSTLPLEQPLKVYRIDQDGDFGDQWPVLPIPTRRKARFSQATLWSSEDNYNILFPGRSSWENGFVHLSIDSSGEFSGNPEGELINAVEGLSHFDSKISTNRIITGYKTGQDQFVKTPVMTSFTRESQFEWSLELDEPLNLMFSTVKIDIAPNGEIAYLIIKRLEDETFFYNLYAVNCEIGEIRWTVSVPAHDDDDTEHWLFAVEDGIYLVYSLEHSFVEAIKFDNEGNPAWDRPFRMNLENNEIVFGISNRSQGGLWYAKQITLDSDNLNIELLAIGENGERIDEPLFLTEEPISSGGVARRLLFKMVSDTSPFWIVRTTDFDANCMAVQGISEDGERLLGEDGFIPREVFRSASYNGCSDRRGGLWFSYNNPNPSVIHFNADGELVEGWTEEGLKAYETRFEAGRSYIYPSEGKLAIITQHRTLHPFGVRGDWIIYNPNYFPIIHMVQVLSDQEPDFVSDSNETPESHNMISLYPNPVNSAIRIEFALVRNDQVKVDILDLKGRLVTTLANCEMSAGSYSKSWDASTMSSGIYLCRMKTGGKTVTKKLMVLR